MSDMTNEELADVIDDAVAMLEKAVAMIRELASHIDPDQTPGVPCCEEGHNLAVKARALADELEG